jgi:hypothetical protein
MSIEQRIECGPGKKLLARVTVEGIKFWCERHRREELRTWQEIDALHRSLMEVQVTLSNQSDSDYSTLSKNLL